VRLRIKYWEYRGEGKENGGVAIREGANGEGKSKSRYHGMVYPTLTTRTIGSNRFAPTNTS
jgi:hypothetical protein